MSDTEEIASISSDHDEVIAVSRLPPADGLGLWVSSGDDEAIVASRSPPREPNLEGGSFDAPIDLPWTGRGAGRRRAFLRECNGQGAARPPMASPFSRVRPDCGAVRPHGPSATASHPPGPCLPRALLPRVPLLRH